jgi:hypothetical protein
MQLIGPEPKQCAHCRVDLAFHETIHEKVTGSAHAGRSIDHLGSEASILLVETRPLEFTVEYQVRERSFVIDSF